jgi:hypothetical protein
MVKLQLINIKVYLCFNVPQFGHAAEGVGQASRQLHARLHALLGGQALRSDHHDGVVDRRSRC